MLPESQTPHTFIVRLWREKSDGESFVWRGSVDCAQSGERSHFQSFKGLMDVIARLAGIPPGDKPSFGLDFMTKVME